MKLCINADDFGYSKEINKGIFSGIDAGVVSACSVLTDFDAFQDIKVLRKYDQVSLGLHFSLTSGKNKKLKNFTGTTEISKFFLCNKIDDRLIYEELDLQFNILMNECPDRIFHIDTHKHIHCIPQIRRVLKQFVADKKIPYLRVPYDESPGISFKKSILQLAFLFEKPRLPFFGLNLMGKNFTQSNILRQINYLKKKNIDKSVWMVHVGFGSENSPSTYNWERETELTVLKEMLPYLKAEVQIVTLNELL